MSKRHELKYHIASLQEISEIMDSIKTLSMLEAKKITQSLNNLQLVMQRIESVIEDFSVAYPLSTNTPQKDKRCLFLFGSERGFCGSFNEQLVKAMQDKIKLDESAVSGVVSVGQKISNHLADHPILKSQLAGVSVLEESNQIIQNILVEFKKLQSEEGYDAMEIGFYQHETEKIEFIPLIPPFQKIEVKKELVRLSPLLNLPSEAFLSELIHQYLFFQIYEAIYSSSLSENQYRVRHLEAAVERIKNQVEEFEKKGQLLRQEEITEEIEVILLSTQAILEQKKGFH